MDLEHNRVSSPNPALQPLPIATMLRLGTLPSSFPYKSLNEGSFPETTLRKYTEVSQVVAGFGVFFAKASPSLLSDSPAAVRKLPSLLTAASAREETELQDDEVDGDGCALPPGYQGQWQPGQVHHAPLRAEKQPGKAWGLRSDEQNIVLHEPDKAIVLLRSECLDAFVSMLKV